MFQSLLQTPPTPGRVAGRSEAGGGPGSALASPAQALLDRVETIEHAYQVWHELRAEHEAAAASLADKRRALEQQGEFLVGAVPSPVQAETQAMADRRSRAR